MMEKTFGELAMELIELSKTTTICCRKCYPQFLGLKMFLCPTCGNKRCPKATDHNLACTNSNEPGQPGSDY